MVAAIPLPLNQALPPELLKTLTEELESGMADLPMLPEAAQRVVELTQREDADAQKVAELVRKDASLAAHVLRVANSPLYSPRSPIVSLSQAAARLGLVELRRIAFVIAAEANVFRVKGFEDVVRDQFEHCLLVAVTAQRLAKILRRSAEEAFLVGLLHDVGKPVLMQKVLELSAAPPSRAHVLEIAEHLHPRAGELLVLRWGLPNRVAKAVRDHHGPPCRDPETVLGIVQVANAVAKLIKSDTLTAEAVSAEAETRHLDLYEEHIEELLAAAPELAAASRSLS